MRKIMKKTAAAFWLPLLIIAMAAGCGKITGKEKNEGMQTTAGEETAGSVLTEETPEGILAEGTSKEAASEGESVTEESQTEENLTEETQTEENNTEGTVPQGVLTVNNMDEIKAELEAAIAAMRQPRKMDISAVSFGEFPENDVKNLYFDITSQNREYIYAYNLDAVIADGFLTAAISYMPYKTGSFPADFTGEPVASLADIIAVASGHLGSETVNIRITNKELNADDMNNALQQAGGGYIVGFLNNDATAITFSPAMGMTGEECLAYLESCDELAESVVAEYVTSDMSDREKAFALYGYLTGNVKYDFRYYTDKTGMPYHSQTAYGALHDDLAICGGYSHALKLLFEKAGLQCFNVSGKLYEEDHMWNIALIDGEWLYFDATFDRGCGQDSWKCGGVSRELLKHHTWDQEKINRLLEDY